jgi:hypothetical protein
MTASITEAVIPNIIDMENDYFLIPSSLIIAR